MQFLVTSNMNILEPKVTLLKDISSEYATSIRSAETVRSECEHLLNRLEFELTMRLNERNRFKTKVGVNIRDLLLEDYRGLINKVHLEFCKHEEIYLWMQEQYGFLKETISNTQFAIQELKKIKKWSIEEINYSQFIHNKSQAENHSFNKENQQFRSNNCDKNWVKGQEWKQEPNFKQNPCKKEWMRVKLSSQDRRNELITMQIKLEQAEITEISAIIDQCLVSLTDFSSYKNKKRFNEIKLSESFSRHSIPEPQSNPSHGISLGLESLNDEVNLLCNELIEDFNASNGSELQRITEREEEQLESEASPTPRKRLTDSTEGLVR